jgi:hypothetical protein
VDAGSPTDKREQIPIPKERNMLTVEIKTGSRRILDYLLSPLMRYRQEVLHER